VHEAGEGQAFLVAGGDRAWLREGDQQFTQPRSTPVEASSTPARHESHSR